MNKNARAKIVTTTVGNMRYTDTMDRDYGAPNVSIETEKLGTGSRTRLTMMGFGGAGCKVNLDLSGHEARTLYRVLEKHYGYVGALKAARKDRDEWYSIAMQNAGEKLRLNMELASERLSHARTREMLDDVGTELLKTIVIEMPKAMLEAHSAGKESMLKPAKMACQMAYRAGMAKGFEAAQQLELFKDLDL